MGTARPALRYSTTPDEAFIQVEIGLWFYGALQRPRERITAQLGPIIRQNHIQSSRSPKKLGLLRRIGFMHRVGADSRWGTVE